MTADLLVIGGGSAGLAAARAGVRLRRKVILVQDGPVGGDCTFTGCVPSKTLIESAHQGLDFAAAMGRVTATIEQIAAGETADVLRGEGIDVVEGRARFTGPREVDVDGRRVAGDRVVLATGAAPRLPDGADPANALTSDTVWQLRERPDSLVVLGGGPVGCELAQAFRRLGVEITLVGSSPRLLSREEPEASRVVEDTFRKDGIELRLGERPTELGFDGRPVLVAIGRVPRTAGLGLSEAGIDCDEKGFVVVDDTMRTSASGVYAAGDVAGRLMFTHAADEMGRTAAVNALRRAVRLKTHDEATPWVTFTDPEVARVGVRESDVAGTHARVAHLPMTAVDRAITAGRTEGFVTLIASPRKGIGNLAGGRLIGATVVSPRAGEMIAELALAIRTGMFVGRLAQTVHAYPTWSTAIRSAAAQFLFEVDGRRARSVRGATT